MGTESYDWDNVGEGANRAAEALLYDVTGDAGLVTRLSSPFASEVVAHLTLDFEARTLHRSEWTEEWRLTPEEVRAWISDPRNRPDPEGPSRSFP